MYGLLSKYNMIISSVYAKTVQSFGSYQSAGAVTLATKRPLPEEETLLRNFIGCQSSLLLLLIYNACICIIYVV
jgi:hypothetical protein